MPTIEHLYYACQAGAEPALKREAAERAPELRLAFSRPGFVTFKLAERTPLERLRPPRFLFGRTGGGCFGRVSGGDRLADLAAQVWGLEGVRELSEQRPPNHYHVWQRDTALPGEAGFEPGLTPLAREVRAAVVGAAPQSLPAHAPAEASDRRPAVILDVVLVEPHEWWVGCHFSETRVDRWPGGAPPLEAPEDMVSRAYLKMREALAWSRTPAEPGDEWIELGCAPGGASQALLGAGMRVVGVDPAEVHPTVAADPGFRALRMRAADARRNEFAAAKWLTADINAAPSYTLDAIEPIVKHRGTSIRGLLVTLKLPDWDLAAPEAVTQYVRRVESWGYRDVRVRQLAFNRREFCLAALRSRGQRRVRRNSTPRSRGGGPRRRRPT